VIRSLLLVIMIIVQGATASDSGYDVTLTYQGSRSVRGQNVYVFTIGTDRNIFFGLTPIDGQAPLSVGDIQICQTITQLMGVKTLDGREFGDFNEIGFLCGGKRSFLPTCRFALSIKHATPQRP
jgi:hypothetical protein